MEGGVSFSPFFSFFFLFFFAIFMLFKKKLSTTLIFPLKLMSNSSQLAWFEWWIFSTDL